MFSKLIVDKRYVMTELLSTYLAAKGMQDNSNRNRSLHLMGLELGMFAERKDVRIGTKFEGWSQEKADRTCSDLSPAIGDRGQERR